MEKIKIISQMRTPYTSDITLPDNFSDVAKLHSSMTLYQPTPIRHLKSLATKLNIKDIYVKDESSRFGLNAFKGLGASYAVQRIIERDPRGSYTFVSCTDGNHGKALAWMANELGFKAIIFMPAGSEIRRVKAIEKYNAQVIVTDMNYDDTVRFASEYAKEHDAYFVQDTALPGYVDVPNDIMLGYSTMVREALEQMDEKPTHVFIQAGVGSLAGGVVWYLYHNYKKDLPYIAIMEPETVACIYESIAQDQLVSIGGNPYTAMAGLNCGEPNPATFPLLKAMSNFFIKCNDELTFKGMRRAKNPVGNDPTFSAGESGAVGLGLIEEILSASEYQEQKELLNLTADSVVLLFSTEGELADIE